MANVTWKCWRTDLRDLPQPTGPLVKREGSLRKSLGKYGASDERQRWFAQTMGDEVVIDIPAKPRR